jgi:type I restriction enzyme S subunit
MPSEWREVEFGSLLNGGTRNGLMRPTRVRGVGTRMVNMGEIFAHRRIGDIPMDRVPFSDSDRLSLLEKGDLLFARQSLVLAGAGKCTIFQGASEPVTFEGHIIRARVDRKKADPWFYFYYFGSPLGRERIGSIVEQVAAAGVRASDLAQLRVPWPPQPVQTAIARILGALDDKIELNRKMNETLEQMARAIFKSWFMDFEPFRDKGMVDSELGTIPKGWTIGVLDGLVQTCLGGDWGADAQAEDDLEPVRCIRGADIPDLQTGGTGKMPVRYLKPSSLQKRRLGKGDIVVEISGGSPTQSTGRSVLISDSLLRRLDNPLVCSNFCRLLKLRTSALSGFVYLWLRTLYTNNELLRYETGTTGIKNFALTLFSANHKLSIPPPETLKAFDRNVAPIFDMQQANAKEGDILAAIRDALLPKLMSGEVKARELTLSGEL